MFSSPRRGGKGKDAFWFLQPTQVRSLPSLSLQKEPCGQEVWGQSRPTGQGDTLWDRPLQIPPRSHPGRWGFLALGQQLLLLGHNSSQMPRYCHIKSIFISNLAKTISCSHSQAVLQWISEVIQASSPIYTQQIMSLGLKLSGPGPVTSQW